MLNRALTQIYHEHSVHVSSDAIECAGYFCQGFLRILHLLIETFQTQKCCMHMDDSKWLFLPLALFLTMAFFVFVQVARISPLEWCLYCFVVNVQSLID